jgi:hypothetical protein
MTRKWRKAVGDPERGLFVELRESFEYPYQEGKLQLAIGREGGGLLPLALDEVGALVEMLSQAAADLTATRDAEAGGDDSDDDAPDSS